MTKPMDPPDNEEKLLHSKPRSYSSGSDVVHDRKYATSRIQPLLPGQFLRACRRDNWDIVDRLLRRGLNPNDRDADFQTTVEYALSAHHIDIAQKMIYYGYDINTLGFHGCLIDALLACWRLYNPVEIMRFIHGMLRRHIFLTTHDDENYPTTLIRAAGLLREETDEFRVACLKIIIRELVMFGSPLLLFFDEVDEDLIGIEAGALISAFESRKLLLYEIFDVVANVIPALFSATISDIQVALKLAIGQRRERLIVLLLRELLKRGEYLLVSSNALSHVLELRLTLAQMSLRRQLILEKLEAHMNNANAFQAVLDKENPSIFRDESLDQFCHQLNYYFELDESYGKIARVLGLVVHKAHFMPFIIARLMGGQSCNSESHGAFFSLSERRLQAIWFITEILHNHEVLQRQREQLTDMQLVLRRIDVSYSNPFNEIMRVIYLLRKRSTARNERQWYLDILRILWGKFFNSIRQDQPLPRELVFSILDRIMELGNDRFDSNS